MFSRGSTGEVPEPARQFVALHLASAGRCGYTDFAQRISSPYGARSIAGFESQVRSP